MSELVLRGYAASAQDAWYGGNRIIEEALASVEPERWKMIRYEDLVVDPPAVMERACRTLGVAFHEAVLEPYEGDRMREGPIGARAIGDRRMATRGKIDPELATSWLREFDPTVLSEKTRDLALELGYELG